MAHTREVITLQLGHYSNFVGTHLWNLQEASFCYDLKEAKRPLEFNHDVYYREGVNQRNEVTYTPRLISVDLKGSLKCLKKSGTLYNIPSLNEEVLPWSHKVEVLKTEPHKKNEFLHDLYLEEQMAYSDRDTKPDELDDDKDICHDGGGPKENIHTKLYNLDSSVEVWSDFLKGHLHPQSVFLINDYLHGSSSDPFDLYGLGMDVYKNGENKETLENLIRKYSEECDWLQAFNILIDGHDAFTGYGGSILEHLSDDYSSKTHFCWPLYQPHYNIRNKDQAYMEAVHRKFNAVMAFDNLVKYASAFCPLGITDHFFQETPRKFANLKYKPDLPYHTSAIISAALDTILCSMKLKSQDMGFKELLKMLSFLGRKGLVLSSCIPLGIPKDIYLDEFKSLRRADLLTPGASLRTDSSCSLTALRGVPSTIISKLPDYVKSHEEVLAEFISRAYPGSASLLKMYQEPCNTVGPFPHIFAEHVTENGFLSKQVRPLSTGVREIPMLSVLSNSDSFSSSLEELTAQGEKLNLSRFHKCLEAGEIEKDVFAEALNCVKDFHGCYFDKD